MENNTLAILVAVILMGFTAIAMVVTTEITPLDGAPAQRDAPFPGRNAPDLEK